MDMGEKGYWGKALWPINIRWGSGIAGVSFGDKRDVVEIRRLDQYLP